MRQSGEAVDREHLYQGVQPASGYLRENFPRWACDTDLDPLTGGVMLSAAVWCQAGDEIRSITFQGGATAANTPTHWWFALYNAVGALVAQTADQTTAAWAANAAKTLPLVQTNPHVVPDASVYWAAVMMTATDLVSLAGRSLGLAAVAAGPVASMAQLARTSGASLTDTAPATIATPTAVATYPYVVLT